MTGSNGNQWEPMKLSEFDRLRHVAKVNDQFFSIAHNEKYLQKDIELDYLTLFDSFIFGFLCFTPISLRWVFFLGVLKK